jgi:nitrate reductase delta subunit
MKSLRVFSLLLDYPTAELHCARGALLDLVAELPIASMSAESLTDFIHQRCSADLLDWQAEYDGLFERGRSLSLLLFEHIHGESRDRGQAMVDLLLQYKTAGLQLTAKELPDYIPLYLEFLSTQGEKNALLGLQEVAHILALILCRLEDRENSYSAIFTALLELSGKKVDLTDLRRQLAGEKRDDTPEALDKVWEEEAVKFTAPTAEDGCPSTHYRPSESQRRDREEILDLRSFVRPMSASSPLRPE